LRHNKGTFNRISKREKQLISRYIEIIDGTDGNISKPEGKGSVGISSSIPELTFLTMG
jgi:hypothetical protein